MPNRFVNEMDKPQGVSRVLKKFLSKKEFFCDGLGVCERTGDKLIANKEVAVVRVGRRVLIPVSELEKFGRRDHRTRQRADQQDAPEIEASGTGHEEKPTNR